LPPLTTKDESDLKLARSIAPPENDLPVHLTGQPSSPDSDSVSQPGPRLAAASSTPSPDSSQPAASNQTAAPSSSATPPSATPPAPATQSGDTPPDQQRRTPPTLYSLPDDKRPSSPPGSPKDTPQ
jgi:hypothetical protein